MRLLSAPVPEPGLDWESDREPAPFQAWLPQARVPDRATVRVLARDFPVWAPEQVLAARVKVLGPVLAQAPAREPVLVKALERVQDLATVWDPAKAPVLVPARVKGKVPAPKMVTAPAPKRVMLHLAKEHPARGLAPLAPVLPAPAPWLRRLKARPPK